MNKEIHEEALGHAAREARERLDARLRIKRYVYNMSFVHAICICFLLSCTVDELQAQQLGMHEAGQERRVQPWTAAQDPWQRAEAGVLFQEV